MNRYKWSIGALACAILTSCVSPGGKYKPGKQLGAGDLVPHDRRPIFSVQVGDSDEAALLGQQLKLETLRIENSTLYFFDEPGLGEKLQSFGYAPRREDPAQVFRRVVRVSRRGSEKELAAVGVRLINREEGFWVVEAPLATLRALLRSRYRLSAVGSSEPRPREVRIWLERPEDVQRVGALQVDIYSVGREQRGFVAYGGAFDYQIDRLKEEGFQVERVFSTP